jgi:hypothetical protein
MGQVGADFAKSVIKQMYSQVGLFVSLSLALSGGLSFLVLQTLIHNHDPTKQRIHFRKTGLLVLAFIFQGASVCLGLACTSAITASLPAIFNTDFSKITNLTDAKFDGSAELRVTAGSQEISFGVSLLLIIWFIMTNWRFITKHPGGSGE